MKRALIAASLVIFLSTNLLGSQANAEVTVVGSSDCAYWVEDRSAGGWPELASQAHLMGFLSGMALGTGRDFWIEGGKLTTDQVFFWMDRYCDNNPLKSVTDGVRALWYERFSQ